ncbi:MAG: nuclear transport factor 2 family protein [Spirochaetaceae bacterium]|nr:nuclear transport factor 2 family protein [Myxococcales bacterium]MCB9726267.1 nuclear transport factor 2 family protein [Spirochaetaceae bacterium]HPG27218.1 nuclear transport factor 2 family protein [Myxococcota bacterium]
MSKAVFDDLFARYTAAVTATDVDAIVGLYAPNAKIQIPVGGPVHDGIDAIRAFYRDNELAESLAVAGPACVAGREAAVPLIARVRQGGRLLELDVIDVAEIDEAGNVLSMRAFFDLEGARVLS